ncbi:low affinity immunoglobulin gamma Fc region receptor II-like [Halichoeres trimaculatus]|uniref:low affinity immunoglobulin gamma Fc region receptor II-like n=1 Tax=Halichoeres trimaculatus TaxID=147232 RepID=UPI003D9E557A
MALTALCAAMVALRVVPDRSQFFEYEHVSLSCEQQGNSSGWTIMRNRSVTMEDDCFTSGEKIIEGETSFDASWIDSGVYWCESAAGQRSGAVNITVTSGSVILQSPALPVKEGDDLTLQCSSKIPTNSSSSTLDFIPGFPVNHSADFYKNGLLIGSSSTGNMTIQRVSGSNEGFYKCNISGVGRSPNSWLSVRESGHPGRPSSPAANTQLPVVVCLVLIFLMSAMLIFLWRKYKGKFSRDVPYTDVTITPGVQLNRTTDVDAVPTFYSTLKLPGNV